MSMQISRRLSSFSVSALAGMILLTGCGDKPATDPFAESGTQAERIDCKVGGASAFAQVCAIERVQGPDGLLLTIRHPDGGFRRLKVTGDGRGVVAADGAEQAVVSVAGDRQIEVTVGGDSYRLPATVKPGSTPGK